MTRSGLELTPDEKSVVEELGAGISQELTQIASMDDEAKRAKNADVKEMIKHFNGLTKEIEDRRIRAHDLSLQILGICAAALGVLLNRIQTVDIWVLVVGSILCSQILVSLWIIYVFERQSCFRYPFLKLEKFGNRWKWFYYGNREVLRISPKLWGSPRAAVTLEPYLLGLRQFLHRYRTERLDDELQDNLVQLYLLLVHNYYKNRFYTQLASISAWRWRLAIAFPTLALAAWHIWN